MNPKRLIHFKTTDKSQKIQLPARRLFQKLPGNQSSRVGILCVRG